MFFSPIFDSYAFAILVPLMLAAAAWYFSPRGRWDVVGLRAAMLLMLLWVLLRPTLRTWEIQESAGSVILLMDTSRSMMVKDAGDAGAGADVSRYDEMRRALDTSAGELEALGEKMHVHAWHFDAELVEVKPAAGKIPFPQTPRGEQSAIGWALEHSLTRVTGERVLAVVLMSDGAQRGLPPKDVFPQTAVMALRRQDIPLYTLCFGRSQQESRSRDLAVEDLLAEQRVFVNTELAVTGRVRVEGFPEEDIPVELQVENKSGQMEVVAHTVLRTAKHTETLPVMLAWTPREVGEVKLSLRVPPRKEELSDANNQLEAFVNVVKGTIPVLYLEGTHRQEMSFLRRALDHSAEIQVDVLRLDARAPQRRTEDLRGRLAGGYAVYILGDVDASCFTQAELKTLEETVSRGAGLLTLGGFQAYGPGGYTETPLVDLFPVQMNRLQRTRVLDAISPDMHLDVPLRMMPAVAGAETGAAAFVMALDKDEKKSRALWAALPPLEGANRFTGLKPGAVILAYGVPAGTSSADVISASAGHPETPVASETEIPLLVEQAYGRGRVMSFAGDSTWRWWMHGYEEPHKRFWRQAVMWLAQKDETLEGNVWITMNQRRFTQDQRVAFQVGARLSTGENLVKTTMSGAAATSGSPADTPGTRWDVKLLNAEGKDVTFQLTRGSETMLGSVTRTLPPGDYTIHAAVTHEGQKIGESRCRFTVFHMDLELDNAQADPALMESLVVSTGGAAVTPAELPELWRKLAGSTEKLQIRHEILRPVWDSGWLMMGMLALLCAEWFLRKRSGMV